MTKIELARFSDSLEKDRISHPENQTEENHGRENQKNPNPGLVLGELVVVVIHAAIYSFQTWSHFVWGKHRPLAGFFVRRLASSPAPHGRAEPGNEICPDK